jgi:methylisocitrate lyase
MVVAPGVYDAITARLMRHLGFEFLYVPGSQTGTVLGTTEPLTTVTQMADVGETVVKGCRGDLPVLLDAGAGFGDPVHVMSAVEALENAGLSAIHIEDQTYPKRASYHRGLEHVVPIDVYQQRLEHALKARRSKDFMIIGRNDGFRAAPDPWLPDGGSREEAVKRAHAAIEVGVDIILVIGVREKEDFQYFRSQIKDIPMMALLGYGPVGLKDFEDIGHQVVVTPTTTITASLAAIHDTYENVMKTGHPLPIDNAEEMRDITNKLLYMDEKWAVEAATTESESAGSH